MKLIVASRGVASRKKSFRNALLACVVPWILTGCAVDGAPFDAQKVLAGMEGPKVQGVEATMKETAENTLKMGDFNKAAQLYQQLMDQYPNKNEYALAHADAVRRSGDGERAITLYDALLQKESGNAAALEGKGLALMALGKYDEAGRTFEQVIAREPNRWRTLNAAGILFSMKGLTDEALAYYEAALKANPNTPSILNNVGLSLAMDKQYDKSVQSFEQALALTPNGSVEKKRIDLNLALVYGIAGKLDDAERVASQHLQGAQLLNNMGYYAHLAKDDQLAKSYLSMALTKSPVFYAKAWENIEKIDARGHDTPNPAKAAPAAGTLKAPSAR